MIITGDINVVFYDTAPSSILLLNKERIRVHAFFIRTIL